jgi:Holliday junction resolvasome RuvABC DNA-binding subunit
MYSYVKGHVVCIERRARGSLIVSVCANGLGIPVRVYKLPQGVVAGSEVEFFLLSAFSEKEGYLYYGFPNIETVTLARDLCRNAHGVGPEGVTALVHGVSYSDLRKLGRGLLLKKIDVPGLGPKKGEELTRALREIFKNATSDDSLGDNMEVALEQTRTVLTGLGVDCSEKTLMELALQLPAEAITCSELVGKYLEYVRGSHG